MSNLSDIGFPVAGEQDVNEILMSALSRVMELNCPPFGSYYRHADPSGAELFIQGNSDQELIGFNPAFSQGGVATLLILRSVERDTSELDGAFVCRPVAGGPTFVFDAPDFRRYKGLTFPCEHEAELTAFASPDLSFDSDQDDDEPTGIVPLANLADENHDPELPPQAHVRITARVVDAEFRKNDLTGAGFCVITAEAGSITIRIAADQKLVSELPEEGSKVRGSFWLSGKLSEE